jgi:methanogenic corrinoid protein MtbC1
MLDEEIFGNLRKSILTYDAQLALTSSKQGVEKGIDPVKLLDAMTAAIREVGDGFGRGKLWVPDMLAAVEAMQSGLPIIEEEIKKRGVRREAFGVAVVGTVLGDIHSIGKTMVAAFLAAGGFEVHDLGVDIKAEQFVEAVKSYRPDILCLSALLTVTAPQQKTVIELLEKEHLRPPTRVLVGGGAITEEFAESIGADGYEPTAPAGAKLARRLVEER